MENLTSNPTLILATRALARDVSVRFMRALEMLENADALQKTAGIYALDGLSRENGEGGLQLRGAITEVLCAFVRRHASRKISEDEVSEDEGELLGESLAALLQRTSAPVQAALTTITRAPHAVADQDRPLDLHAISLREAVLPFAHLESAFLYDCDFEGALLFGAHLRGAWLARANFTRANLDGADLRGADLSAARGLNVSELKNTLWDDETRWP